MYVLVSQRSELERDTDGFWRIIFESSQFWRGELVLTGSSRGGWLYHLAPLTRYRPFLRGTHALVLHACLL